MGRLTPEPADDWEHRIEKLQDTLADWTSAGPPAILMTDVMAVMRALHLELFRIPAHGLRLEPPESKGAEWADEIGLPLPRRGLATVYSAPSRCLVVTVTQMSEPGQMARGTVWVREIDEARYRAVVLPATSLGANSLVVCDGAPLAYLHTLDICADGRGANDGGLFRIRLPAGVVEHVPIALPPRSGWVSDLFGASADGTTVYLSVSRPEGDDTNRWTYHLASADTRTGLVTELAALPGIFA